MLQTVFNVTSRLREVIPPLYSGAYDTPSREVFSALGTLIRLVQVQKRAVKIISGLEHLS